MCLHWLTVACLCGLSACWFKCATNWSLTVPLIALCFSFCLISSLLHFKPERFKQLTFPFSHRTKHQHRLHVGDKKQACLSFLCRFFLMYLINKDETEHTGQVGFCPFAFHDSSKVGTKSCTHEHWCFFCGLKLLIRPVIMLPDCPTDLLILAFRNGNQKAAL